MRSILVGGKRMFEAYNAATLQSLIAEAGLDCTEGTASVYTADDLRRGGFEDVDCIFATWGMAELTEDEIRVLLPNLKCVFYAAGTVQYFARPYINCGVHVFSAWEANSVPVVEYAVSQILLAGKGFYLITRRTRSPEGRQAAKKYFKTLPGNFDIKVGILGAGMIGKQVIQHLKSCRLEILVYDPFLSDEKAAQLGVRKTSLEEIFSECQVISNHIANLPATVGIYDYSLFSKMKENAVFINTGRGAQVVEEDLIRALREKPDMTAVLDVTYPEPPVEGSPFYELENVFLTPHIAGAFGKETERLGEYVLEEFRKFTAGEKSPAEVTLKMLETMA